MRVPISPCTHQIQPTVVIVPPFCYGHPSEGEVVSRVVLICVSLMTADVEHFFICLLAIYIFFEKVSNQALYSFLNRVIYLFIVDLQEFLIYPGY